MIEHWKDIHGYEGLYLVSTLGRIKSLDRIVYADRGELKIKNRILKQTINDNGYLQVTLSKNGVQYKYKSHRIVAKAFIKNPDNKRTVNHINYVKTDNRVDNLEWATHSENHIHAYRVGGRKKGMLGKIGALSPVSKIVTQYTKDGFYINVFDNAVIAEQKTGVSRKHICSVCTGKRKSTGGYIWRHEQSW